MRPAQIPEDARVYTIAQACRALQVSEPTLRDGIRAGHVPVLRLGRRQLIPRVWLEKRLEEVAAAIPADTALPANRAG